MASLPPLRRPDLHAELIEAVDRTRHGRHHPDCRCGEYQGIWCTPLEKLYSGAVDKLLDQIRQEAIAALEC